MTTETDSPTSLAGAPCSAPCSRTFDELCADTKTTCEEREALVHHLAGIRYRETLKLIDPPIVRAAKASADRRKIADELFASDGKESVLRDT